MYEQDGRDDDRPARIRHLVQRTDNAMRSEKTVRFLDDDSAEFFLRNGTELTLQPRAADGSCASPTPEASD